MKGIIREEQQILPRRGEEVLGQYVASEMCQCGFPRILTALILELMPPSPTSLKESHAVGHRCSNTGYRRNYRKLSSTSAFIDLYGSSIAHSGVMSGIRASELPKPLNQLT